VSECDREASIERTLATWWGTYYMKFYRQVIPSLVSAGTTDFETTLFCIVTQAVSYTDRREEAKCSSLLGAYVKSLAVHFMKE